MVRVVLDASVPHRLSRGLAQFDVKTAQCAGLGQRADGARLVAIDGRFDAPVTRDRGMTFQQKIVISAAGPGMMTLVGRAVHEPAASPTQCV
ncbi:MAG: hypothetical protein ACKVP7_02535 [Hyphomicrobiaceae bacterium]